ncbi:MAG: hypothetical protein ACTSXQ_06430 [Alphaproteobacteria bacterium]
MTTIQIIAGVCFFLVCVARPIAFRPLAVAYPMRVSAIVTAVWAVIAVLASLPFMYERLLLTSVPLIVIGLSLLKGVIFWYSAQEAQNIRKESVSSSVFFGPIGVGGAMVINNLFFGEGLSLFQILSILFISIVSLFFFSHGHAKTLTRGAKKSFVFMVLFLVYFLVCDHIVISETNWYFHMVLTTISFSIACFLNRVSREELKISLFNPKAIIAGISFGFGEFVLLLPMVTIIPVSIAGVFGLLSVPVVMLLSARVWKENKWQEQALFGGLIFLVTVPLILF